MNNVRTVVFIAVTVVAWMIAVRQPATVRWVLAGGATVAVVWHLALRLGGSKDDDDFVGSDGERAEDLF